MYIPAYTRPQWLKASSQYDGGREEHCVELRHFVNHQQNTLVCSIRKKNPFQRKQCYDGPIRMLESPHGELHHQLFSFGTHYGLYGREESHRRPEELPLACGWYLLKHTGSPWWRTMPGNMKRYYVERVYRYISLMYFEARGMFKIRCLINLLTTYHLVFNSCTPQLRLWEAHTNVGVQLSMHASVKTVELCTCIYIFSDLDVGVCIF